MRAGVRNRRRILCVFPAYSPSFGTFEHAYKLRGGTRAFMPPQGLLVVAAYLPAEWEVRFVDENLRPATAAELAWADAVLVSGMHVQRCQITEIGRRARRAGKATVLGGPSVSGCPEQYPEFDYLHIGEIGDATDRLIAAIDCDPRPPQQQMRFVTEQRLPLESFPVPAYHLVPIDRYFLASVQFSSGCPYRCEFCDIPALYGRNPRLKTPQQVTRELDAILAHGNPGAIYFVDDNFIGNRRAARELVEELILWQKRRSYPIEFACEATLNIAKYPELLARMREAFFLTIFCGIETPEEAALHAMAKDHNASLPILDAVRTINGYGMEIVSGIIMGLDTDSDETPQRIIEFAEAANIPMLTINLLQALPRTPLWDRLAAEGRLCDDAGRESNVVFKLPYEKVVAMWQHCVATLYRPDSLYRRFAHHLAHTYPNRIKPPAAGRATWRNMLKGVRIMANLVLRVGLFGDYKRCFWRTAWPLLRAGRIDDLLHIALVAHHLIRFAREASAGAQNAAFYAPANREADSEAELSSSTP